MHTDRWLDVLFGSGDDDFPFWLMTVRADVLIFLLCTAVVLAWKLTPARLRNISEAKTETCTALALTVLAGVLRFLVASPNLMDFGGVPYSRLLFGYKGYFATAQVYSLLYELTARDIEHAILFDRLAGTLTIPLVYVLCRHLQPGARLFPAVAAFLFAVHPLHVLFSASDALAVFSVFLAAASYVLLAGVAAEKHHVVRGVRALGAFAGLALLTQVRYENALLLVPPALFLLYRRHELRFREVAPPLLVATVFGVIYAYAATTSGLSYRNPFDLGRGLHLSVRHLFLNPFLALPHLLVGTVAISVYGSLRSGALALLPWAAALGLCVSTAGDGHGCARIFANWLILVLPFSGYGFSLMLRSPQVVARAVAAVALLYFGSLPLSARDRLAAQYLEILENDRFRSLLAALPPGVERIIVPDDEPMLRRDHSTLELYGKYEAILRGNPDAKRRVELVPLTSYLESPEAERCVGDACLFFFGIPCMDGLMFPETRNQCEALLRTRRTTVVDEATVVAAPFVLCSVYIDGMEERLCAPALKPRRFVSYRVED